MPTEPKSGASTSEFKTWVFSMIVSVVMPIALSRGWLTQGQVSAITAQASVIGGLILAGVSTVTYQLTRLGVKWKWIQAVADFLSQQNLTTPDVPPLAPAVDAQTQANMQVNAAMGVTLPPADPGATVASSTPESAI